MCEPFEITAQAVVEGEGSLTYAWQARTLGDVIFENESKAVNMIPTKDTERVESKLYYRKNTTEDGQEIYQLYIGGLDENSVLNAVGPGGVIYEKVTTATIGKVGKYVVTASNRVRHAITKTQSYTLVIPWPVQPIINTNLNETGILEGQALELTLKVDAEIADAGSLRYYWFRKAPGAEEFLPLEGQGVNGGYEVNTFKIVGQAVSGQDDEGNDIIYIVDENGMAVGDGYYYCLIENNINGERETIQSDTIRISHRATKPNITVVSDDAYTMQEIGAGNKIEVHADIPAMSGEMVPNWRVEDKDTITYQWFRYYIGNGDLSEDIQKALNGTYEYSHDKDLSSLPDMTEEEIAATRQPSYSPAEAGYYYCMVTNTYNGTTASKISPFFSIADA